MINDFCHVILLSTTDQISNSMAIYFVLRKGEIIIIF
jgi:hypothetical protein